MKYPFIFFLSALIAQADPVFDPFGVTGRPPWTAEIDRQKPLRLLIACAETPTPLPSDPAKPPGNSDSYIVTDEFLGKAKVTTVAVSDNDIGALTRNDGIEIKYRVKKVGEDFSLSLQLAATTPAGNKGVTNTELNIPSSTWQVVSVSSRHETKTLKNGTVTDDKRYYSVAVRIDSATSAK